MSTDGQSTSTTTKTLIIESFGKAGPWAILVLLILGGVGYEADYFLRQYVKQSDETMSHLRITTDALTEPTRLNLAATTEVQKLTLKSTELIDHTAANQEELIGLMKFANESMQPVAIDRAKQTKLLEEIKNALESNRVCKVEPKGTQGDER